MNTTTTAPKAAKKTVRVYSYGRISTKIAKQVKGRGIKRQDEAALKWCADNGHRLEPANCFFDKGVSAFKAKNNADHGELKVILNLIDEGEIEPGSILLVESLDRLSRKNVNIAVQLLLSIINAGVVVVTLIDGAKYTADANPQELMASLMMSVAIFMRANDESRTKSARKADSWKKKREAAMKGAYHGGRLPAWLEVVGGTYRIIEEKAKIVRSILTDYAYGAKGLYRLSADYGVPMPTIATWLDNAAVIGTLTLKEGKSKVVVPNHYPSLFPDRKVWDMAQQKRGERYIQRRPGRLGYTPNLFASLLTDPKGKPMIVAYHNGGLRNYTSRGHVIRCRYLEEVICFHKLASKFVKVKEVEQSEPSDPQALARIEADLTKFQATMMEEPTLAARLLPVVRKLEQEKRKLISQPTVVREAVDFSLILNLLKDEGDHDGRLRLQELVRQTIAGIRLTKVEASNWFMHVHGVVTLTDGLKCPFSYAYNTRREGYVITDNHPKFFFMGTATNVIEPKLTDDVKEELAKLPKMPSRKERGLPKLASNWKKTADAGR